MKIIGRSSGGYIVELSQDEINGVTHGLPFSLSGPVGKEIDISASVFDWSRRFRRHEEAASHAADHLRMLADMITTGLPSLKVPEPEPEEPR